MEEVVGFSNMHLLRVLSFVSRIGRSLSSDGMKWKWPLRREEQPEFGFVYVNQDGSARELSANERAYLSTDFAGADGGRPYIKSNYDERDGWGSLSGFLERRSLPDHFKVEPVNPDYDKLVKQLQTDPLALNRAAGDIIVANADGSVTCTPNPDIPHRERFERSRNYRLAEQRRREDLAKT